MQDWILTLALGFAALLSQIAYKGELQNKTQIKYSFLTKVWRCIQKRMSF